MTDDGRLDLDESGDVLDGGPVVDLADPGAGEALAASPLDSWVERTLAPAVRRHRRMVAAVTCTALAVTLGTAWWTHRPPEVPPTIPLVLENAIVDGGDLGGPRITPDGVLTVAYAATSPDRAAQVSVVGLVGPGLVPPPEPVVVPLDGDRRSRVQVSATVRCDDPTLADAVPSSYGLAATKVAAGGQSLSATRFFDGSTTDLSAAVLGHCLDLVGRSALDVSSVALTPTTGSSVAGLEISVRNTSAVPLVVSSVRDGGSGLEIDDSPDVSVGPGASAVLATRLLVHDCSTPTAFRPLGDLPNPAAGAAAAPAFTARLQLGSATMLASFPLAERDTLAATFAATACQAAPRISASLVDTRGVLRPDGTVEVRALYAVSTTGIGVSVGREHFSGGPAGQGSVLATGDPEATDATWVVGPSRLDGGAGRILVTLTGSDCTAVAGAGTPTIPFAVTTAAQRTYPFEVPADPRVARTAARACGAARVRPLGDGTAVSSPALAGGTGPVAYSGG